MKHAPHPSKSRAEDWLLRVGGDRRAVTRSRFQRWSVDRPALVTRQAGGKPPADLPCAECRSPAGAAIGESDGLPAARLQAYGLGPSRCSEQLQQRFLDREGGGEGAGVQIQLQSLDGGAGGGDFLPRTEGRKRWQRVNVTGP